MSKVVLPLRTQHVPFILSPVGDRESRSSSSGGSNYVEDEADHTQAGILSSGCWVNKEAQIT